MSLPQALNQLNHKKRISKIFMSNIRMAINMLDKRKQDKNMGSENIYLKIEATMKEDGEII